MLVEGAEFLSDDLLFLCGDRAGPVPGLCLGFLVLFPATLLFLPKPALPLPRLFRTFVCLRLRGGHRWHDWCGEQSLTASDPVGGFLPGQPECCDEEVDGSTGADQAAGVGAFCQPGKRGVDVGFGVHRLFQADEISPHAVEVNMIGFGHEVSQGGHGRIDLVDQLGHLVSHAPVTPIQRCPLYRLRVRVYRHELHRQSLRLE
ncbi:hypothetical protein QP028_01640 [Corynebacterium suedekumii]|nr:hypothetical protein QP028_01640 [Corynebacterium suedekumii]